MPKKIPDAEVEAALAAHDFFKIEKFLGEGLEANWQDAAKDTLLHHAARMGDEHLVAVLLAAGAKPAAFNAQFETPADVALVWGRDYIARDLKSREGAAFAPAANSGYASLQEIRDASARTGVDQFHHLARQGRFAAVAQLAAADGNGFTAADLLGGDGAGENTLLVLAQRGELNVLLKPELWVKKPQEFQTLWAQLPLDYKAGLDAEGFLTALRQAKLQSYAKPKLGPKFGFKN